MAKYLHPPFHFLPTIERMSIYLQKVCYKPSLSIKYSYFAFNSINIRSEYGMYHFHGTFLFIYQMVFEQACARPFLVQTFGKHPFSAPKTLIYKDQMRFMMAILHCDIISFKFTYLQTYIHYDFRILTFIKLLFFWGGGGIHNIASSPLPKNWILKHYAL